MSDVAVNAAECEAVEIPSPKKTKKLCRICATEKLRDLFTEILTLSDDIRKGFGVAGDRKSIREFVKRKICPFKSGPSGGDIQISSKVIDGSCHRVLFFEDPASAHPHQFDIRLLEKAVQSDRTATLFATSTEMAELIV